MAKTLISFLFPFIFNKTILLSGTKNLYTYKNNYINLDC